MFAKRCPRADELKTYVDGGQVAAKIKRHVEECNVCSDIVAGMARQNDLIDTVRQAVEAIDDETRSRAAAICKGVARVQPLDGRKDE